MKKKNNLLALVKKELARLFGDTKLVFSGIILQGLIIYIMYNLMGLFMGSMINVDEDYQYKIAAVNMPASIQSIIAAEPIEIINVTTSEIEGIKKQISEREIDVLVEFPANFDEAVAAYEVSSNAVAPQIQIWANMAQMSSMQADSGLKFILSEYERTLAKKFDINALLDAPAYDLNTGADFSMTLMMSLVPMLLIMVMYQGCMAIAPESIAGEKERGTLGTILATPAKRTDMALAKVLSISVFGILGSIFTFGAMMLSLPKMMGGMESTSALNYSVTEYALIFLVSLSTVLVFVSLLSIMSAYAKSVKEAAASSSPLMMVSIVLGMSAMFTGGAISEFYFYFIPVFNSAQSLTAILNNDISSLNIIITILANITVTLIGVGVVAKMFNSEKIVFDK